MMNRLKLGLASVALVGAIWAGSEAGVLSAAQTADPSVDCLLTIQKDGKSWTRQGTGWIRTVPAPGGGTDSFSMANYESNTPVQTKTLNCSTDQWDEGPL